MFYKNEEDSIVSGEDTTDVVSAPLNRDEEQVPEIDMTATGADFKAQVLEECKRERTRTLQ